MSRPEYVKVGNIDYKINTDFRIALECNEIAKDGSIGDYERALAVIYKLFGEDGLKCENLKELLKLGMKYLTMGIEKDDNKEDDEYELDFNKCVGIIKSSFKFDYNYDPYELEYLHYYDFMNDLENLSTSEFGNCCIFNRVNSILREDVNEIKDKKYKKKIMDAKEKLRKKYCVEKVKKMTKEQEESAKAFYKSLGVDI